MHHSRGLCQYHSRVPQASKGSSAPANGIAIAMRVGPQAAWCVHRQSQLTTPLALSVLSPMSHTPMESQSIITPRPLTCQLVLRLVFLRQLAWLAMLGPPDGLLHPPQDEVDVQLLLGLHGRRVNLCGSSRPALEYQVVESSTCTGRWLELGG